MKTKIIKYITIILIAVTALYSCNDLDLAPTNRFTDANYWTSTEKAAAVLNMAYSQMFGADFFLIPKSKSSVTFLK